LSGTDAEEATLNTFSGRAGAARMKDALIVGVSIFVVAAIVTLVTLSVNLSNKAFEVALS
jgi:hypothetical protein